MFNSTTTITPEYQVGERVYNHNIGKEVTIDNIHLTPQKQLLYGYKTDDEINGVASSADLGNAPDLDDVPDSLYINSCTVQDILTSFPSLPGGNGKQSTARKIIKARNETPFTDEINFIGRMTEIEPKCEWEAISYKLRYDLPEQIGV